MNSIYLLLISFAALSAEAPLEPPNLQQIGMKVWQNECRGTVDGLITWNAHEEFPSLGIGHFIWHPEGISSPFEQTFPHLIEFITTKIKDTERTVPSWIKSKKGFPWKSREEFQKEIRNPKVTQLRQFLSDTLDLQTLFLLERFKIAEEKLALILTDSQKLALEKLKNTSQGAYALIDYINFKGTGLALNEQYRGEGWGLLQVLQNLPESIQENKLLAEFVTSAKKVLARRVHNAPLHRKEEQWLNGWYKRVETYLK